MDFFTEKHRKKTRETLKKGSIRRRETATATASSAEVESQNNCRVNLVSFIDPRAKWQEKYWKI